MSRIAIFGRQFSSEYNESILKFLDILKRKEVEYAIYQTFSSFLEDQLKLAIEPNRLFTKESFSPEKFDVIISIGGDGTMLDCTTLVGDSGLPMLGLNTGRLGFLSSVSIDYITEALDQIIEGAYMTDQRSLIKLETESRIFGKNNFALNDFA
jgi:NAD+ kinase